MSDADVVIVATNHSAYSNPEALAAIASLAGPDCLVVGSVERARRGAGVRLRRRTGGPARVSRVLVTGGAGTIGAAVVRRLLRDPDFEVRVSDQRPAPMWMREGCEVHTGDLRVLDEARKAMRGCTHVIHLAAIVGGIANFHKLPHTLTEVNNALYNAVFRAALDEGVERCTYVSLARWCSRTPTQYPTREDYLPDCPVPAPRRTASPSSPARSTAAPRMTSTACRTRSAARSTPTGRARCPTHEPGIAHAVPDLIRKSLQRLKPLPIFGTGEHTRTLTHVDDIADGIVTATGSPAGLNEDFNISAAEELTVAEIARICWVGVRQRPGRARVRAPAELRGRRRSAAGRRWRRPSGARLEGQDRRRGGHRPDRRLAACHGGRKCGPLASTASANGGISHAEAQCRARTERRRRAPADHLPGARLVPRRAAHRGRIVHRLASLSDACASSCSAARS